MNTTQQKLVNPGKASATVIPVSQLSDALRHELFCVFAEYYEGVEWLAFQKDLEEKDDVIVIRDDVTNKVCGFSTIVTKRVTVAQKQVLSVFSGDTILKREYWGSPALGLTFLVYLFKIKIRHPFTSVYWMLISKGYKTYLLMNRNFAKSFPSVHQPTPLFEKMLMDCFYSEKFGGSYDPVRGQIKGDRDGTRLKGDVAPITEAMRAQSQEISFFCASNPEWHKGVELACLAEMELLMPLKYFIKKVLRNKNNREAAAEAKASRIAVKLEQESA